MPVADITEVLSRVNRILFLSNSYSPTVDSNKKRGYSTDEVTVAALESDEQLCLDIRETLGHPYAPQFFIVSSVLAHKDPMPVTDGAYHKFEYRPSGISLWQISNEGNKSDILEAIDYPLRFGATASESYGFHYVEAGVLMTTSPEMRVTSTNWTRTSACQSPQAYTWGVIAGTIRNLPKDGMDSNLWDRMEKSFSEARQMVRARASMIPELVMEDLQKP